MGFVTPCHIPLALGALVFVFFLIVVVLFLIVVVFFNWINWVRGCPLSTSNPFKKFGSGEGGEMVR